MTHSLEWKINEQTLSSICEYLVANKYRESHRFYHNLAHANNIAKNAKSLEGIAFAYFHDAIYDPRATDNEEKSVELMEALVESYKKDSSDFRQISGDVNWQKVKELILLSKHRYKHYSEVPPEDWEILKLDLDCFLSENANIYETELAIFKEYQFVDFEIYAKKRIEILCSFGKKLSGLNHNIKERLEFLVAFSPRIGVFAGSFNPWHKGHQNILEKAEKIFDKVIVAVGANRDKKERNEDVGALDQKLHFRQVESYDGLLTDYLKSKKYPTTLIRGLRDGNDLAYEANLLNVLRDVNEGKPLDVIHIICDREYQHISSSVTRQLKEFGVEIY